MKRILFNVTVLAAESVNYLSYFPIEQHVPYLMQSYVFVSYHLVALITEL